MKKEKEILDLSTDRELSAEDVLKALKDNYILPNSEITKVELKKGWLKRVKLNIVRARFFPKLLRFL